jgi:uncharacterized membrane protein
MNLFVLSIIVFGVVALLQAMLRPRRRLIARSRTSQSGADLYASASFDSAPAAFDSGVSDSGGSDSCSGGGGDTGGGGDGGGSCD